MALDGQQFLISAATYTAGTNSSAAKDYITTPGGPRRGYSFMTLLGTVANTGASASTLTITLQEGSETAFTNVTNTNIIDQRTVVIGATATATPEALNMSGDMTQEFLRATIAITALPAGVSAAGVYVAMESGRYGN